MKLDGELKPDWVLVAILKTHIFPTDRISQADVLWVETPKTTELDALVKHYQKHHPDCQDFSLRHDFEKIDLTTSVGELAKDSEFVALEAVTPDDVIQRTFAIERYGMSDVNHVATKAPVPEEPASQASHLTKSSLGSAARTRSPAPAITPASKPMFHRELSIRSLAPPQTQRKASKAPQVKREAVLEEFSPAPSESDADADDAHSVPFETSPSPQADTQPEPSYSHMNLNELFANCTPEQLEKGGHVGVELLVQV